MLNLTALPSIPREPTPGDIAEAEALIEFGRAVKRSAELAAMRQKRREARAAQPRKHPKFKTESYRCGYCGRRFRGRVLNRPVIGHWCSHSCRTLAYLRRRSMAAKREAMRARVLAEVS